MDSPAKLVGWRHKQTISELRFESGVVVAAVAGGWLPEGHLARFVAEVVETLDLSATYAVYEAGDGRGLAAYDPRMMVRVLIYGYCRGLENVAAEWKLICATHNHLKLFRSGWSPQSA